MMKNNPQSPQKVCFLKRHLGPMGGLEKYTRYLASAFADRGHHVTLVTGDYPERPLDERIELIPLKSNHWASFQKIRAFDKATCGWLEKESMDIVMGMDRTSKQTHIRAGNGVHKAFLERRRQIEGWLKGHTHFLNPTNQVILDIEKRSFEDPELEKLFTNSAMVRDEVVKYYDTDPAKVEVIHNGVEHEALGQIFGEWEETRGRIISERNLNREDHHIVFIGNGYFRKGLVPLMKGLAQLKSYPFHLHVIGKEKNISTYRDQAIALGLKSRISFLGPQPATTPFYALADTVAIPSYYDPFANVTVEALAMGTFVISSKLNGGHEILTKENGLTIPSLFDIDSVVETLKERLEERKTDESARKIRASIAHLDFKAQLNKMIDSSLSGRK